MESNSTKELINNCLEIQKNYFKQFGLKWETTFLDDLIDFSCHTIHLQRGLTDDDYDNFNDLFNEGFLMPLDDSPMTDQEINEWCTNDIPDSFLFLIQTMDITGQENDSLCRIYVMMLSLIGAYLFQNLLTIYSLKPVQYFGKYIRHLDAFLNLKVPKEKWSSNEPTSIYLFINGKKFDEVFDDNCNLIDQSLFSGSSIRDTNYKNSENNTNDYELKDDRIQEEPPLYKSPAKSGAELDDDIILKKDTSLNDSAEKEVNKNLDKDLRQLNNLIGLQDVKKQVQTLTNLAIVQKERQKRNLKSVPMSQHLVFIGNPGTGKTTVARLIGNIYHDIGILSKGHVIEADRSDLVAEYVGQTAIKTKKLIDSALGGVLFIDEAYSITSSDSGNDFGQEAITILLKEMEDNRNDLVVIVAGYPKEMNNFINSNPGLKSRFKKTITFEDYNAHELSEIYEHYCSENGYKINQQVKEIVTNIFQSEIDRKIPNFANARFARNLFEKTVENQANRIIEDGIITDDEITEITEDDLKEWITYLHSC